MARSDELSNNINWAMARKEDGNESGVEIEITNDDDEWIISILEERPIASSHKQLHKVPRELREEENKRYFDPRVVSIGPYHHGKPELKEAEKLKSRAVRAFIGCNKVEPHEIYNRMLQLVSEARNFYLEGSTDAYDNAALARMMLDGCFILQFIHDIEYEEKTFLDELMKHVGHAGFRGIIVDIILLENQLPFLVLQALISSNSSSSTTEGLWEQLIENFIVQIYIDKRATWRKQTYKHEILKQPLHLLDLMRRRFLGISQYSPTEEEEEEKKRKEEEKEDFFRSVAMLQDSPQEEEEEKEEKEEDFFRSVAMLQDSPRESKRGHKEESNPFQDAYSHSFRSATELKARGIHFRPSTTFYLNDFTFTSRFGYGQLTLPQVSFGHKFRYCILNMMAYELAPSEKIKHPAVCCYIYFMNSLINGVEDVIELRSHNIIHIFYGTDEQVAKAFNSMATVGAYVSYKGPIKKVSDQIQKHYNSRMKTWRAQLFHNYFSNPWSAVAFFAATFILVLTFIQTFFPR